MSCICEAFGCTPLEALEQPYDLAMAIMDMRAYATTHRMVKDPNVMDIPESSYKQLIAEFMFEQHQTELERRQKDG